MQLKSFHFKLIKREIILGGPLLIRWQSSKQLGLWKSETPSIVRPEIVLSSPCIFPSWLPISGFGLAYIYCHYISVLLCSDAQLCPICVCMYIYPCVCVCKLKIYPTGLLFWWKSDWYKLKEIWEPWTNSNVLIWVRFEQGIKNFLRLLRKFRHRPDIWQY